MEVLLEQMHVLNKQMEEGQEALRLANMQFASLADELAEAREALSAKEVSERGLGLCLGRAWDEGGVLSLSPCLFNVMELGWRSRLAFPGGIPHP